jgi:hypothetical protein
VLGSEFSLIVQWQRLDDCIEKSASNVFEFEVDFIYRCKLATLK